MNKREQMHPEDKKNLFIFLALALLAYFAYDRLILQPKIEAMQAARALAEEEQAAERVRPIDVDTLTTTLRSRDAVLAEGQRIQIDTPELSGSINLQGGRIDDVTLKNYYKTVERTEPVVLASPAGSNFARFVDYGWIAGENTSITLPDARTVWELAQGSPDLLRPGSDVTLRWVNDANVIFRRTYSIDEHFLIKVEQQIVNNSGRTITLHPYALVTENGLPPELDPRWIIHEGPIGYVGGELHEISYKKMAKEPLRKFSAHTGWIGMGEKYWLLGLVPPQTGVKTFRFIYSGETASGAARYQTDMTGGAITVPTGTSSSYTIHSYIGAKKLKLLSAYEKELGVNHFDLAMDFGLLYFLTKPIFYLLLFLYNLVGNFGISLLILTFIVRLFVFPLANTSYRSFAKLRMIAPQMKELREKHGSDKQKLQQGLVALYQKENVNPMAGCLPILLQIPIFFALYKVLSISIEMRHAPFFGWIQDLSVMDPTTVFNLFGLIPWQPPSFFMIGAWPCIMLCTLLLQRSMNPPPQDKLQADMFALMPYISTIILAKFAAGLVIYWTFSNILSIIQQYVIMRSMGAEVKFFQGFRARREAKRLRDAGPDVHPEMEVVMDQAEHALFPEDEDKPALSKPKPKPKKKKK